MIRIFLFSFIFVLPRLLVAQTEYNQFYTIDNLLSKELIKSVSKDNEGYLWIATDDGILRYDGYETRLFYKELPNPFTKGFLKTKEGRFFVLHDFGLREIVTTNDSVSFEVFRQQGAEVKENLAYPKSVFEDQNENIWVGEYNALLRFSKNGFKRFDLGEEFRSIDYHRTFSFTEDAFGNLWIAPWKGPLLFYNKETDELERIALNFSITAVSGIATVKGDYLLIGGAEGLVRIKTDSNHKILEQVSLTEIGNVSIIKVIGTNVFVGTWTRGLYHFDFDDPQTQFHKFMNVPINDVVDLFFDENNSELWIAGSEQIGLFKPTIVSTLYQAGQNRIETLQTDKENHIYYSVGQKLYFLENTKSPHPQLLLSTDETYYDRILIEGHRVWIGDAFGVISYLDLNTKKQQYLHKGVNVSIKFLSIDNKGNKWFTGHSQGLIRVDSTDNLKFYKDITQSIIVSESSKQEVYLGCNGKDVLISKYNHVEDTFEPLQLDFSFDCPSNIILNDFLLDSLSAIWLATNEGLLKVIEGKKVDRVIINGINTSDPVRAVARVGKYICFANAQGLVIYNENTGEYILFNQDSGLPSKLVKERGLTLDQNGNLLVATAKGMAYINREAIQLSPTVLPILKSMSFNGSAFSPEKESASHFPYKSKVEAEFIALAYPASNIVYQSRILGIDKNWSALSSNRNLSVLGFSDGSYVLEVRARADGKLWSEPLSIPFIISKPWYRTWWAWVLFIGGGIIIVSVATNVHNNNLIRQKNRLRRVVEQRTEEINRQKNEIIEQQNKLIQQKEELIAKNETVYKSQQALNEADMNYLQLKEKQLQDQIEYKNKQITTHALNILQKNETLRVLKDQLEEFVKHTNKASVMEIKKTLRTIDESFKLDKDWEDFKFYFEQIHTGFYSKLKVNYPDLTPLELRHCALIRLNLTLLECATILGISNDSIKVSRTRLRKKLKLDPSQSLTDFILGI